MKNSTLIRWGITHAVGVLIYVILLATFFNQANGWFGEEDKDIITPVAAIMLFIFSALLTGGLVLAKPIMLYIDGQKKDGFKLLLFTGISMFVLTILAFSVLLIMR